MVCSLCGNKQAFILQDFPLSHSFIDFRICVDCHERVNYLQQDLISDSSEAHYQDVITYIESKLDNLGKDSQEYQYIQSLIQETLRKIQQFDEAQRKENILKQEQLEKQEYIEYLSRNMMVTNAHSFEGYSIVEYKGVVSGESVLGTGFLSEFGAGFSDFFGIESNLFSEKIASARTAASQRLVHNASQLEANAVIAISYSFANFTSNMVGVMSTGTAVVIKKE